MDASWLGGVDVWVFQRSRLVHPQPVALASYRLLSAQTGAEAIDAALKAAEVLARYLAAVCLAAWRARDSGIDGPMPDLSGPLAFGHFRGLLQAVAKVDGHALHAALSVIRGGKKGSGDADTALGTLVEIRNEVGHGLSSLTPERVAYLLAEKNPIPLYASLLRLTDGILAFPLFVPDVSVYREGRFRVTRSLLMGESTHPDPDTIDCVQGVDHPGVPHLSIRGALIVLPPMLGWRLITAQQRHELLLLDGVGIDEATYASLHSVKIDVPGAGALLREILAGGGRHASPALVLTDGRTLDAAWVDARGRVEAVARSRSGTIPWDQFDPATVGWYARQLGGLEADPASIIRKRLLDQRSDFTDSELRQLTLLFGRERVVRETLRRAMLDIRAVGDDGVRLEGRRESSLNILATLREAVGFVVERLRVANVSAEAFDEQTGGPDYIAIREGLVNQFGHQDYADERAAAQITLLPGKTIFFNPGYSLVGDLRPEDRWASVQRNPLVARALKLMGWAESAGMGVRRMYETWQRANRRQPWIQSDEERNTFTLELTWDAVAGDMSAAWKARLGVELTGLQATVLEFVVAAGEPTVAVVASSCGVTLAEAETALARLAVQGLVGERGFRIRPTPAVKAVMKKLRRS